MFDTALYIIDIDNLEYDNLSYFSEYYQFGVKEIVLLNIIDKPDKELINKIKVKTRTIEDYIKKLGFGVRSIIRAGVFYKEVKKQSDIDLIILDKVINDRKCDKKICGLLDKIDTPVLIRKQEIFYSDKHIFNNVTFATDFSEYSLKVLPYILSIPVDTINKFNILHIFDKEYSQSLSSSELTKYRLKVAKNFDIIINKLQKKFLKHQLSTAIRQGISYDAISDYISETKQQLLIIGDKGLENKTIKEKLFGNVTSHLIKNIPCSILIIK